MNCPSCGEKISIWESIKLWVHVNMPRRWHYYIQRKEEDRELKQLKALYNSDSLLTDREHFVCRRRVDGLSIEEIAKHLVVTRERIRQIQAKALRKLQRKP